MKEPVFLGFEPNLLGLVMFAALIPYGILRWLLTGRGFNDPTPLGVGDLERGPGGLPE